MLFAAGLAIASAFESGGVIEFIADNILYRLESVQPLALSFSVMLIIIIIRIGFTNFNSMVASTMPLILTLGIISDINPVWLGMVYLMASSTSFFIPTQAIGSMTTYSLGYYTSIDFFKVGLPVTLAIIIVTLAAAFYYWPVMGLSILE
ncbi:anion permease [Sinobaca sp. H24]|uniref:anion permease n=1 Tax=Sinobaca sp. H24 TaxID=2923376 RepID=UPI0035B0D3C5